MGLHYVTGDATGPHSTPFGIVHVCNDLGAWGAGFTGALSRRYALPERLYRTAGAWTLGVVQPVHVALQGWVYNCVAQHGIGRGAPRLDLLALGRCLDAVAHHAAAVGLRTLHMPRIGCGLAGGRWSDVEPLLQATCGHLDCFVYDLP